MENIRTYSRNPVAAIIAGLIIGIVIGILIGWIFWPVQWINASPEQLSNSWQVDFLRMAITSYNVTPDAALAQERYNSLGDSKEEVLAYVSENPGTLPPASINQFAAVVGAPSTVAAGQTPGAPGTPAAGTPAVGTPVTGAETPGSIVIPVPTEAAGGGGGGSRTMLYLGLLCLLLLAIIGVAVYLMFFRNRFAGSTAGPTAATQAAEARKQASLTDYTAAGEQPPTAQFMASYKLGDDLFDDSFSIDSQGGEFLGECGVGISETIGVGDPKKVTAFEVWLFDKNDIQTVTKVLMSPHAYNDSAIRQRLEAKGETLLASPGAEFILETQTLTMSARVADMSYGEGAMPAESYFDHLLLELAIWQKPEAS